MNRLKTGLLLTCLSTAACTIGEPLALDGTWNLTVTTGAGTCVAPGTTHVATTMVALDGDNYVFTQTPPDPDETLAGDVTCSEDHCDVTLVYTDHGTTTGGQPLTTTESYDVDIDADLAVTGTGTLTASGGVTCSQTLTVAGTID